MLVVSVIIIGVRQITSGCIIELVVVCLVRSLSCVGVCFQISVSWKCAFKRRRLKKFSMSSFTWNSSVTGVVGMKLTPFPRRDRNQHPSLVKQLFITASKFIVFLYVKLKFNISCSQSPLFQPLTKRVDGYDVIQDGAKKVRRTNDHGKNRAPQHIGILSAHAREELEDCQFGAICNLERASARFQLGDLRF